MLTKKADKYDVINVERKGDIITLRWVERRGLISVWTPILALVLIFGLAGYFLWEHTEVYAVLLFCFGLLSVCLLLIGLANKYEYSILLGPDGLRVRHRLFAWCFDKHIPLPKILRFERIEIVDFDRPGMKLRYCISVITTIRFQNFHYCPGR